MKSASVSARATRRATTDDEDEDDDENEPKNNAAPRGDALRRSSKPRQRRHMSARGTSPGGPSQEQCRPAIPKPRQRRHMSARGASPGIKGVMHPSPAGAAHPRLPTTGDRLEPSAATPSRLHYSSHKCSGSYFTPWRLSSAGAIQFVRRGAIGDRGCAAPLGLGDSRGGVVLGSAPGLAPRADMCRRWRGLGKRLKRGCDARFQRTHPARGSGWPLGGWSCDVGG